MLLFAISFFSIILVIGFTVLRRNYKNILESLSFALEFRNNYVAFVNELSQTQTIFQSTDNIDATKYMWLQKNSSKMQSVLGLMGIVEYIGPFGKYQVENYQVVLNTIPKFRGHITKADINLVDDSILNYLGATEQISEKSKKELSNPVIWLREGFRTFFALPFYIFNWLGIIPDVTLSRITSNSIFKVLAGIGAIFAFLSAVVTIIQGRKETIEFIRTLFGK